MLRPRVLGFVAVVSAGLCYAAAPSVPKARAQRAKSEPAWEYKVGVFSYNPGERSTDAQRASAFERVLNEQAREGWEPVGSVLSRDTIQTVGGGVTTRDTTSFVAYRRTRR